MGLDEQTRSKVIDAIADYEMEVNFSDKSLVRERIVDGWTGLEQLSDEDLVNELASFSEDDDELVMEARSQLEIYKILKDDKPTDTIN